MRPQIGVRREHNEGAPLRKVGAKPIIDSVSSGAEVVVPGGDDDALLNAKKKPRMVSSEVKDRLDYG